MANRLGMTENQMITEIETMRDFEKYLIRVLGEEQYHFLCQGHAKEKCEEALKQLGATDEEIVKITAQVENELGWRTEKQ